MAALPTTKITQGGFSRSQTPNKATYDNEFPRHLASLVSNHGVHGSQGTFGLLSVSTNEFSQTTGVFVYRCGVVKGERNHLFHLPKKSVSNLAPQIYDTQSTRYIPTKHRPVLSDVSFSKSIRAIQRVVFFPSGLIFKPAISTHDFNHL